jgi:tetratricopeptide (TPR) repeat protein
MAESPKRPVVAESAQPVSGNAVAEGSATGPQASVSPAEAPSTEAPPAAELQRSFWSKLNPRLWFRKETTELRVKEGDRLRNAGNRNQALVAFHKALALDPNCADAHRGLGRVTLGKGGRANAQAALAPFQEAGRLNPYDGRIHQALAIAYEKLGKGALALPARKKLGAIEALQANAADPVANNNMGVLCAQQEHMERAVDCFKKSIEGNRKYAPSYRNLATTYYRMATAEQDESKRGALLSEATTAIERTIDAAAPNLLAHARILIAKGEALRALDMVAQAEPLDAASPTVYQIKRAALEKLGRMTEAQHAHEAFEACLKLQGHGAA